FGRAAATAVRAASRGAAHALLEQLDRLGASVLLPDDDRFPPLLRDIPEPPALLYAWGDVGLLARPAAGVVGSRNHTAYGGPAAPPSSRRRPARARSSPPIARSTRAAPSLLSRDRSPVRPRSAATSSSSRVRNRRCARGTFWRSWGCRGRLTPGRWPGGRPPNERPRAPGHRSGVSHPI